MTGNMDDEREALRSLLSSDETLREAGAVNLANGAIGPADEWEPVALRPPRSMSRLWAWATRTTPRKVVFFTLLAPLALYAAIDSLDASGWLDRLVGGTTCTGQRGSLARGAQRALQPRPFGPGADTVVVSDQRLILVRRGVWRDPRDSKVVFSVALADVAAARVHPRGLLRRRVEVTFTDTSTIVLALPSFRSPSPRSVVMALTNHP